MNILMMTNTYLPHVGGVAQSVSGFSEALREMGHRILVVAPQFDGQDPDEEDVVRVPAIQNFNGSDFSVRLPIPGLLSPALEEFAPQIVHSHHPFLMGDTALRVARGRGLPLVFTHHTLYERYTHYVPGDSELIKQYATRMASEYANLCNLVIAPSESIATLLQERGVQVPVRVVPSGIDCDRFCQGDGKQARRDFQIPPEAFVVGHVGRLAPEKNLSFLAQTVARLAKSNSEVHFLLVGDGPSKVDVRKIFQANACQDRLHETGTLKDQALAGAYQAMDVFAFASQSETQGLVMAEAMSVGLPVVAVDAPGVREVVQDEFNGILLPHEDADSFGDALQRIVEMNHEDYAQLVRGAQETAESLSRTRCTKRLVDIYRLLIEEQARVNELVGDDFWSQSLDLLEAEWTLWSKRASAAIDTLTGEPHDE